MGVGGVVLSATPDLSELMRHPLLKPLGANRRWGAAVEAERVRRNMQTLERNLGRCFLQFIHTFPREMMYWLVAVATAVNVAEDVRERFCPDLDQAREAPETALTKIGSWGGGGRSAGARKRRAVGV